jgi:hypothetical protein
MTYTRTGEGIEEAARLWRARGAVVVVGDGWMLAYFPCRRA